MTQDNESQEQIERGMAAQELLNSKAWQDTFALVQNGAIQHWAASKPSQTDERESAYYLMRAMNDINALLNQQVQIKDQILDNQDSGADHE
jgi:hypothetical protein